MANTGFDYGRNYPSSLRERVFQQLEDEILNGKYKPGDSLIESKLSEEFGISRTPIREALMQLELEGLVQSIPNKGVVVKGVSAKDVEDIYTIRKMIEGLAARWATEKANEEELKEMKEILELEEFYTLRNDIERLIELDSRFHELIFKASKSKPLMQTLKTFHQYVKRARNISMSTPGRAQKSLEEHRAILQAIVDRDPERAERLTTEHVSNASKNLLHRRKEDIEADHT